MRAFLAALLAIAVSSDAAIAVEDRYDRKLDRAAAEIVAARIGALRGGFDVHDKVRIVAVEPEMRRPVQARRPAVRPGVWQDGLAIAVERKTDASPDL